MWWYTVITGWLQCSLRKSLQFFPDSIKYDVFDLCLARSLNNQGVAGFTQNLRVIKGLYHGTEKVRSGLFYFKDPLDFCIETPLFLGQRSFFLL